MRFVGTKLCNVRRHFGGSLSWQAVIYLYFTFFTFIPSGVMEVVSGEWVGGGGGALHANLLSWKPFFQFHEKKQQQHTLHWLN